ncbi:MAG: hypothetical protein IJV80_05815, partial [Clostridia bacterium]|nr:hypothetical protein [Clostridia bacterium]
YNNVLTYALDELLENYTDEDDFKANYANVLYDGFSFYDNARFLRYDETADEKQVGDSYTNYDSTSYKEEIAYLLYTEADETVVFANYNTADKDVPPVDKSENDTETDDSTTEETPATPESGMNVWLLVSSLVISAALLFAIGSIVVRKIVKNAMKNKPARTKSEKAEKNTPARRFSMRQAKKSDSDKKDEE